jgi:hypothetical protein
VELGEGITFEEATAGADYVVKSDTNSVTLKGNATLKVKASSGCGVYLVGSDTTVIDTADAGGVAPVKGTLVSDTDKTYTINLTTADDGKVIVAVSEITVDATDVTVTYKLHSDTSGTAYAVGLSDAAKAADVIYAVVGDTLKVVAEVSSSATGTAVVAVDTPASAEDEAAIYADSCVADGLLTVSGSNQTLFAAIQVTAVDGLKVYLANEESTAADTTKEVTGKYVKAGEDLYVVDSGDLITGTSAIGTDIANGKQSKYVADDKIVDMTEEGNNGKITGGTTDVNLFVVTAIGFQYAGTSSSATASLEYDNGKYGTGKVSSVTIAAYNAEAASNVYFMSGTELTLTITSGTAEVTNESDDGSAAEMDEGSGVWAITVGSKTIAVAVNDNE